MALRGRHIQGLDVERFPHVGSRETYVPIILPWSTPDDLHIYVAGSGKSIAWLVTSLLSSLFTVLTLTTSSAVIQFMMTLRDAGKVMLAYFYFDYQDEEKQNVHNFVTSLLVQFSAYSKPCYDLIYRLYLAHGKGTQQPSMGTLIEGLKEMLTNTAKHPIFLITDALDECPDSGLPTPREAVLNLIKDLVNLRLPNLRIFVTSRPEVDIQAKLKPLAVNSISLHDETRQRIVISNYVGSVVSSDERMRKWRDEDKKLVIEELSERAGGM